MDKWNGYPTWAEMRMAQLQEKPKSSWDEDDWDAYNYIQCLWAERDYYDSLEG